MAYTHLDIEVLRTFVTVADLGGFTAAGARLGRTQAAVSIQIKKLEELLQCRVIDRTSRVLKLTRAGESLLAYARRILELNDQAVQFFRQPGSEGELRLGVEEYFVPQHLTVVLSRFVRACPRIHVEVKIGHKTDLLAALDAGALDLAITRRDSSNREGRPIRREQLCWSAAHSAIFDPDVPLPLCVSPPPCFLRAKACAVLDKMNRPWRIAYTSDSVMGVIAAAKAGLGVAILPRSAATAGLAPLSRENELPDLGEIELALFGENQGRTELTSTFLGFVDESLKALGQTRLSS